MEEEPVYYDESTDEDVPETQSCIGCAVKLIAVVMLGVVLVLAIRFVLLEDTFEETYESRTVPAVTRVSGEALSILRTYVWPYERCNWTWVVVIPTELYNFYKGEERPWTQDYSVYVTHPDDEIYFELLAHSLQQAAGEAGYDKWETANFAASFVQSLPYREDIETTGYKEYPRFPIETLDNGGDCEDTSILMAALLEKMGYDVVLLHICGDEPSASGHYAVGLEGDEDIYGWRYEHNGKKYYYLETTGEGWKIGDMRDEYKEKDARIYDIIR